MSQYKRLLSLLLCLALWATISLAYGESPDNSSVLPSLFTAEEYAERLNGTKIQRVTDEPKTVTVWITVGGNGAYGKLIEDLADMDLVQTMAEKTGVSLEFQVAPMGQDETSFSMMMASGNWPDIIFSFDSFYADGPDAAISDGVILDLNDYMEYMPNYNAARNASDFRLSNSVTDEGHQPYICSFSLHDDLGEVAGGPIIRQDLLDDLGLDMPVTIDDWYEFLTRCRDELGMTRIFGLNYNGINKYNAFNCTFGFGAHTNTPGEPVYQIDGVIQYAPLTDGYRQYLETMAKWYAEGLIDPDFTSTLTFDDGVALLTGNECAAAGENAYAMEFINSMGKEIDPDFNFVACPNPVLTEGDQIHIHYPQSNTLTKVCAISSKCEDPELVLSYIDQYYTDEAFILNNLGTEGKTYTVVDGMPAYTDLILNNENGTITDAMTAYTAPPAGWFHEGITSRDSDALLHERSEIWSSNADNAWQLPAVQLNQEEKAVYSELWGDISSYVDEMTVKFIMGLEPMEAYDQFVETLKNEFRVDELIAAYQSALDRYLSR